MKIQRQFKLIYTLFIVVWNGDGWKEGTKPRNKREIPRNVLKVKVKLKTIRNNLMATPTTTKNHPPAMILNIFFCFSLRCVTHFQSFVLISFLCRILK